MLSVVDAINATKGFIRPMREGEQIVRSGMVISVGKKAKEGDLVHVQALVLRTSGITTKEPAVVEMWIDLSKEYGERIVQDNEDDFRKNCGCPAGNSEKCKHIVGVMLYLTSVEEDELDDLSSTDVEQQWGSLRKSTLKEYEAKRLEELCHVKGKRDVYVNNMPQVTKEMEERWRMKLMNCAPLGEYSIFMSGLRMGQGLAVCEEDDNSEKEERLVVIRKLLSFRTWSVLGKIRQMTEKELENLSPTTLAFYNRHVVVSLDKSVEICACEQGSQVWQNARKVRQSASKARAQYTYYANSKANWDARFKDLFLEPFSGNEHTDRGLVDEVLCRERYEEKFQCCVFESGSLIRPEVPWLSASLDGTVLDSNGHFVRNIEIKSFLAGTRLTSAELFEMEAIPTLDKNLNVKVKTQHYAQMQLGMLLSGMGECDYCLYSSKDKDFVHVRVPFDGDHCLELCSRLIKVYFQIFLPKMQSAFDFNNNDDNYDDSGDGSDDNN